MLCEGKGVDAIARELGRHKSTVYDWTQRPDFRAELDRIQQESIEHARQILRAGAARAARRLMATAAGEVGKPDTAEVKAATEVLDRVGVTATQVLDLTVRGDVRDLSDEDLDRLIAERLPRHDAATTTSDPN